MLFRSIGFTSPERSEGRTSIVLTLAQVLVSDEVRILLVDADFENPDLADQLGLTASVGLWEVVTGRATLEQALQPLSEGGLCLLPLTSFVSPADLNQEQARLKSVLRHARDRFDLLLVDAGPIQCDYGIEDLWIRGCLDAMVTVSSARKRNHQTAEFVHWQQIGVESLGIIETFA